MRRVEVSYEERHLEIDAASGNRCLGMQRTDAASKKQMLAYLLAGILRMRLKLHELGKMQSGSKVHCLGERCFGIQKMDA